MQVYTFTWHIMFLVMTLPSNQTFNWRLGVILWTVGAQVNHRSVREYLVINRGRKGLLKLKSNRLEQKVLTMVCIVQFFSTYTNRLTKQPIPCMEACVRSRLLYATQAWYPNSREINELEVCWYGCLRRMVKAGFSRKRDQNTGEQLFSYTYYKFRTWQHYKGTSDTSIHQRPVPPLRGAHLPWWEHTTYEKDALRKVQ